ncbi:MAG: RNA polymerase sigma-I factor [Clostridia bacterium]|nr:RNA polymerase sigma-I factor [Clostridia bacterium]MDD4047219.1 RNA polymerase sigma-I factor [Clostridia bacterium]
MLDLQIRQNILEVQQGRDEIKNELITKYLPFILKVTARTCRRFVRLGEDDEVSIALMAFNEALDKYDFKQNTSFFSFAETVIKRRIIDYFRKTQQGVQDVPCSSLIRDGEDEEGNISWIDKLNWRESKESYFEDEVSELRREEVLEFIVVLREYGIELQELTKISPKHKDARATAHKVARIICENNSLRDYLRKTRTLPLKELEKMVIVSRKTLERQRKYIIALTVIMLGEFYFLQEYLREMKG